MPLVLDATRIDRLRRGLAGVRYTAEVTGSALGHDRGAGTQRREWPLLERRVDRAEPRLATALRLFMLEQLVPADAVDEHLAPLGADDLVELGLATEHGGDLSATVRIVPHDPFLVASDPVTRPLGPDHVTGATRPTTLLDRMTVRTPVRSALDLGTGCGILALICAGHSERVVATDVNEHALELTDLNAALNGVRNVETRLGSFLEPVEGERFELVVSNPPYVISPETAFVYRDAGRAGDGLSEEVVRLLPAALAEGGHASVTISWVADDDLTARPVGWLEGSGCDCLLFHTATDDLLTSAASWNLDVQDDPERYGAQIDRWVDWYREHGIAGLAYGVCVMRRTGGPGSVRTLRLPGSPRGPASDQILRLLAAPAAVEPSETYVAAPDTVLRHSLRLRDGAWTAVSTELALESGLPLAVALDGPSAAVVSALDGRPLQEAFAAARARAGADATEFDEAALRLVQQLAALALVVPAPAADAYLR